MMVSGCTGFLEKGWSDMKANLQDVEHHHDVLGSRETGEATKRTCEKIIEFIGG